jgi:2-oxoisovalerate dehydrogenase E1 component
MSIQAVQTTKGEKNILRELIDGSVHIDRNHAIRTLEIMCMARTMDDKMEKLARQNKGATFQMSVKGHEMIGALAGLALKPGFDWAYPYYRDRAFALGLGCAEQELLSAFLARDIPHHSGGRMMPDHFSHRPLRIPCQSSCVGSQYLQAAGCALGVMLRGQKEVVYVSGGDGSTSQGDFHEALNFSCIRRLPILFVIQDNGWAISVPSREQTAGETVAGMAVGYEGLSVLEIDGCDYEMSHAALCQAVCKARLGDGPSLIVAKVPRIGPHSNSDDPRKYKSDAEIRLDGERDPIIRFEQYLIDNGVVNRSECDEMRRCCFQRVEDAAVAAGQVSFPNRETASSRVYVSSSISSVSSSSCGEAVVLMDAINHALVEEMERDQDIVVFGEDVARGKGGVFGITRGLTDRFGADRCFNTPLAESTIIGLSIGLSVHGIKSIAEIQFADYFWSGANQLFNELASIHYRSNGEWNCPVVIRIPYGGYIQGGPYHSQSVEAFLCHCPGLKVVIPSNAADAKRLLKAAIRDPNPVIFLEHKALYRQRFFCARPEPLADDLLVLGQADIVREGSDATVVAWGMTVLMAHAAAETLSREGLSIEVIDLRTLSPLDFDTVLVSLKKTGKLLIAHEAPRTCGFGAELAARAAEEGFHYLDAPVVRFAGKDCPIPYCKDLEEEVLPKQSGLEAALRKLIQF